MRAGQERSETAVEGMVAMTGADRKAGSVDNRRGFMKLIGLGGVASGVTAVTGVATAEAAETKTETGGDYRETEHVKTYYERARF